MRITQLIALLCLLGPVGAAAQTHTLTGRVTDQAGQPLAGVRVEEKGTLNAALTTVEGRYTLRYDAADAVIRFAVFGYRAEERLVEGRATLDVQLNEGIFIESLEVVGSRRVNRTSVNTPVAVDVIDMRELTQVSPQLDVNQLLQYMAPSFNANRQSGADGSDHIDPATLRGLGPDQTLVLVNGKRRHQSSLINIFGSRGRGNTGTDLNAIPVSAIERIEILRDGASAQYGSDAIAGVINIVLKSSVDELTASVSSGFRNAKPPSSFDVLRDRGRDGEELQLGANYGIRLGEAGFINATAELLKRDRTNRPADPNAFDIYRRQFGDAGADNIGIFLNSRIPLSETSAFYAFGGFGKRDTDAYAWTREPDSERNVPEIYPDGFDPRILSEITDWSVSAGVRTRLGSWDVDVNNTHGSNRFHYSVEGTLNASLLAASPTRFDAGGFDFSQNTTGINFSRFFPTALTGLNVAFGAEFRFDSYGIFAGEEGSYRNYGVRDTIINGTPVRVDVLGRPAGSQGFPGFQPSNELEESRTNFGAYVDAEADLSDRLMVGAAARFENYSDFGSTINAKLATRLGLSDAVALRASLSTGFRAPSLAQVYFNTTFTDFVAGQAIDKLIARNDALITRALGIAPLKEETAVNASLGLTARTGNFTATIDGYYVDIEDRIVLTGAFEDSDPDIGQELQQLGVGAAQFFTNALDTRSLGIDMVLTWATTFGQHRLRSALTGNFNDMELGDIHTTARLAGKEDIYFGMREQYFLLASAPGSKIGGSIDWGVGRVDTRLHVTRFGKVVLIDWLDEEDIYDAKYTTDFSLGYRLSRNLSLTLGGANIFNRYPTQQDTETETGGLWDAVQMGFSGAYYFARASLKF